MPVRGFQAKLLYLTVGVLVLLQAITLLVVHVAGQRTIGRSVGEELRVGSRVFDRLLLVRGRQLSDTVRVLASDFAFREAIASGDRPTIVSVLANHSSRIGADAAMLVSLDGTVVADTMGGRTTGRAFPLPTLLGEAQAKREAAAIATLDGRPYQLVVVPVLAPRPIAWICMGFPIDESVLSEVYRLTALDVTLWNPAAKEPLLASTLPTRERGDLLESAGLLAYRTSDVDEAISGHAHTWQLLVHPLHTADSSRVITVLQRSIAEAARPYRQLELQIFVLSTLALIAAVLAAMYFARTVSQPLQRLAEGAREIERGDYNGAIDLPQDDELGELAIAFNRMRTSIADREEQIRFQSTHDALTGLPNRSLFIDRLDRAIAKAHRDGEEVGLIVMDVDGFKEINDTLGHPFGDQLLMEIGHRLRHTLRESDTVARLGGDEFAVTFYVTSASVQDVTNRVNMALEAPFVLAGVSVEVGASMGVALYPQHAEDGGSLLKRADIAMYDAKKNHVPFAIYEPGRDEHSLRRLAILSELRGAVGNDDLELFYQPKIDLRCSAVTHAEALVRWRHPAHGVLSPDEFIPLAEQSGNISMITKWVLRRAIRDCGAWNAAGLALGVAVNLSALDLLDSELPTYVAGILSEEGVPASRLVLEITESAVMKDPGHAQKILRDLKSHGVVLSIDDYGTGYSSLAHLKRLPVDELKIDKSFVLHLRDSASDDLVIVRSTIELGHNMGLKVIAEGVENAESWQILKDLGCDMAQGYYISRPLPVVLFRQWLHDSAWGQGIRPDAS